MAIILNDNLKINAGKPIDSKYLSSSNQPYTDTAAVIAAIPQALRHLGLTVNVANVDYWWHLNTTDGGLVIKDSGIANTGITSAYNGLTKVGSAVVLGGTLTGSTVLTDTRGVGLTRGVQYGGDYSGGYNARSLADAGYVTGKTSAIQSGINLYTGTTLPANYYNQTQINYFTGTTLPTNYYNKSQINNYTGKTNTRIGVIEGQYVTGATNGICKTGAHDLCLGGALIQDTCLAGSYKFTLFATTNVITGATTCIGGTTYLKTVPAGSGGLLCRDASTGQICQTSLAAFGGITGATNGIVDCGSQHVGLGGKLCATTNICGAGQNLSIGTAASKLGNATINASGNTNVCGGIINLNGFCINMTSSGATFTDSRPVSGRTGIQYAGDYSLTYNIRSLVDKGYVDSIAVGLNVHPSVIVATTGAITLSGNQIIDGVMTTTGMRVLVKNQNGISGATTNGIYDANSGAWTRSADYDGTPSGEVSNGDLIPVTSGNTQNSSLWVQVALNPITVGTTPQLFTEFATIIDVVAGNGISVTMVGGTHTVAVNLATNSGLCLTPTQLCVASTIAGNGLSYASGVLDVNAASCGAVPAIPVGYNAGDCLVVACSDISAALGTPINTANNGLTKAGSIVSLGGTLTGATNINVASDTCSFTFTDTAATKRGICYAGDYTGFVDRSLVTKYFVNNAITGGTGISKATNGLTKTGSTVILGGSLTHDTIINTTSSYSLQICGAPGTPFLEMGNNNTCGATGHHVTLKSCCQTNVWGKNINIGTDGTNVFSPYINVGYVCAAFICDCTPSTPRGLQYFANYGATFVDRSLVDKGWVNDNLTGATSPLTYVNGLTHSGIKVCIGGALCTGTTQISVPYTPSTSEFVVGTGQVNWSGGRVCVSNSYNTAKQCVVIGTRDAGGNTTINTISSGITVTGSYAGFKGAVYASNYSANFVDRSLVDKGYVTGLITGGTGISKATNGLTKAGNTVVLGGTLTGTTTIVTAGSIFEMCNTGGLDFSFGSSNATISNNNNRLYIDNTCAALCGNACTVVNSLNGSVDITAASASYVNITAPSGVTLQSTPPAGLTSDEVLVWNSGDKKIKTVNGASLGDKNNIYAMTVVTTSTALGTGDTYVQIVYSPSVSVTLTLPATPINGQVFRIKDAGNNAVNYPITVAASGGKVIDNGAGTASLNTDGGALELVYNASLTSWFVFSFVN